MFIADGRPVVVLCSGADRVDPVRLAATLGAAEVRRATAEEARAATGYAIGGIPPFGHVAPCRVIADRGLLGPQPVWAAAGLPDAVFEIDPDVLLRIAGADLADVRVTGGPSAEAPAQSSVSSSDSNSSE